MLDVGGMVPLSTTDFPDRLSAVVFLQGCPWKCSYCHNPGLQPRPLQAPMSWDSVLEFLDRRVGLLDAVVFSGGEPTLQASLGKCIDQVRRRGFKVGLHTAGIYPRRFAQVLPRLDWVGLDIKAPFNDYSKVTGRLTGAAAARESLHMLIASEVPHEVRTTYHPALFPEEDLLALAASLSRRGVRRFALQLFNAQGCRDPRLLAQPAAAMRPPPLAEMKRLFETFVLRPAGEAGCA